MKRNQTCREIVVVHLVQAGATHHAGERCLVWMHANRFSEIPIGRRIAGDPFAEPRQQAKRIHVVDLGERLPDARKLEHEQSSSDAQHTLHFCQRPILVRHVAQAECNGHAIEGPIGERQALRIGLHRGQHAARIEHSIATDRQHSVIDVGHPDLGATLA